MFPLFLDDNASHVEGGLFSQRGNRFYLPNSSGPAWQSRTTTIGVVNCLEELIDFQNENKNKLFISTKLCPHLIKNDLKSLFPSIPEVHSEPLTLITLKFHQNTEKGAQNFVLAAGEICKRLRYNGYFADFINPFSGKPYNFHFSTEQQRKLPDKKILSNWNNMQLEAFTNCTLITFDGLVDCNAESSNIKKPQDGDENGFSGIIFSNIFSDLKQIHELIMD